MVTLILKVMPTFTIWWVLALSLVCFKEVISAPDGTSTRDVAGKSTGLEKGSKDAYVTLLYGDGKFVLGARVLGQSLRETGTTKDMIVLCTTDVQESSKEVLRADGWTVKIIDTIENPYKSHFHGVHHTGIYSKLLIWNMTEYDRIVFLDSDVLVVKNIDRLFDCGTFCVRYRHSDLFNSGVIVVEPNATVFRDILEKVPIYPSYTHGDQGFLNIYFQHLKYAPMFDWEGQSRQKQPKRLPAGLNADVGMYYLNSHWSYPSSEVKVIHYTMGPTKPWLWWTSLLFDMNWNWTEVRKRLPRHGHKLDDMCASDYLGLYLAPFPVLLVAYCLLSFLHRKSSLWCTCQSVTALLQLFGSLHVKLYRFLPLVFLYCSYFLAFKMVPSTLMPSQAGYVFWLWSNFFLLIFIGSYCYLCHIAAGLHGNQQPNSSRKKLLQQTFVLYLLFCYQLYCGDGCARSCGAILVASEGVLCAGSGACAGEPSDWTVGHRHVDWLKTSSLTTSKVAVSSCAFSTVLILFFPY